VLHGTEECKSVLEEEGDDEPGAGQVSNGGAKEDWLAGGADVGTPNPVTISPPKVEHPCFSVFFFVYQSFLIRAFHLINRGIF
jgi:hypothetical protein